MSFGLQNLPFLHWFSPLEFTVHWFAKFAFWYFWRIDFFLNHSFLISLYVKFAKLEILIEWLLRYPVWIFSSALRNVWSWSLHKIKTEFEICQFLVDLLVVANGRAKQITSGEWVNEWMNEWSNEWMSEWMKCCSLKTEADPPPQPIQSANSITYSAFRPSPLFGRHRFHFGWLSLALLQFVQSSTNIFNLKKKNAPIIASSLPSSSSCEKKWPSTHIFISGRKWKLKWNYF